MYKYLYFELPSAGLERATIGRPIFFLIAS